MYSFPIEPDEQILKKDHANLYVGGNAFNGALYLTNERLVFVGYLLDLRQKYMEEIPLVHIKEMVPEKTFYLIPNVLVVTTIRGRKVKIVVNKRDEWLTGINKQIERIM